MVSMQPIINSYVPETDSCYNLPKIKVYNKGSVMDVLVKESPLFAYLAQVANLDDDLDDPQFNGTVFAPCKEYSNRYYNQFINNIDHLTARRLVLSSLLRSPMMKKDLELSQFLPTEYRYADMCLYSSLNSFGIDCLTVNSVPITKAELLCANGVLYITSGLITN